MPQYELNFRDYLRILRKRRFIIVIVSVIVFFLVVFLNLRQTPIYQAECLVKFEQRKTVIGALLEQMYFSQTNPIDTELSVIQSWPVAEGAAKKLGFVTERTPREEADGIISKILGSISARAMPNTKLIGITITSDDAEWTAKVANKVAEAYVEETLNAKKQEATNTHKYVENQLAIVEANLKNTEVALKELKAKSQVTGAALPLENKLADLRSDLSGLLTKATVKHPQVIRLKEQIQDLEKQRQQFPENELEFARLTRDMQVNEKLYMMLREKFEQVRIAEAEKTSDASIIDPAITPKEPIRPNKRTGIVFGIVIGLVSGFIFGFVTETLDTSIGTIEDVESLLKIPVLGIVPSVKSDTEIKKKSPWYKEVLPFLKQPKQERDSDIFLITQYKPKSQVAESYRILGTNLKTEEKTRKLLLITSSAPREGKTTVCVNLALVFSQMGAKTILVDTDLRRPRIASVFGLKREPGLNELISGTVGWPEVIKGLSDMLLGKNINFEDALKTPGLDNLSILSSGKIYSNPAELLAEKEMSKVIEYLKNNFDIAIFDSPPVLSITDASILAPKVDGVILVYEMGRTSRDALLRSKMQLESVGAKVLGVVLNHTRPQTEFQTSYYPYYYRYRYKYYEDKKQKNKGLRKPASEGEDLTSV